VNVIPNISRDDREIARTGKYIHNNFILLPYFEECTIFVSIQMSY
jgi:hypothetical protein